MVEGAMVLTKGVCVGTLFQLDVCTIECNSSLISAIERSIRSTPSQLEHPKQVFYLKNKLHVEKTMLWKQILVLIGERGLQFLKKKSCGWIE